MPLIPVTLKVLERTGFRLLILAILVGIVSGCGALFFYFATNSVEHLTLGTIGDFHPPLEGTPEAPSTTLSTASQFPIAGGCLYSRLSVDYFQVGSSINLHPKQKVTAPTALSKHFTERVASFVAAYRSSKPLHPSSP